MSHTYTSAAVELLSLAEDLEPREEPVRDDHRLELAAHLIQKAQVYALLAIDGRLRLLERLPEGMPRRMVVG